MKTLCDIIKRKIMGKATRISKGWSYCVILWKGEITDRFALRQVKMEIGGLMRMLETAEY